MKMGLSWVGCPHTNSRVRLFDWCFPLLELQCDMQDKVKHVLCRIFRISRCRCHLHNEKIFIHPDYNPDSEHFHHIRALFLSACEHARVLRKL